MRCLVLRLCCLLALANVARAQATWDFTSGTGAALSLPSNISGGTITATNATIAFNATSASTGYTGASSGNSAAVSGVSGALSTSTSTYFTFTLTAATNYQLTATSLRLGSRSTPSGPVLLTLYSSADNFTTALGSVSVSNTSTWALVNLPSFSVTSATSGSLTFRVYGSGGSSTGSNWRIDDVALTVSAAIPPPSISTQPASQTVTAFTGASFTVAATGTGTLTYQWRKNSSNISGATAATYTIASATTANAGSYDVIVTDNNGSSTSTAATLTVNKAAATVTLGSLSPTYDGSAKSATATTNPSNLTVTFTYAGSATPPSAAGSYAVVGTINDPNYTGTASGTLVIAKANQTVTFPSPGAVTVGVPVTLSATASSSLAVAFSLVSGNGALTGASLVAGDTAAIVVRATQAGDANTNSAFTDLTINASSSAAAITLASGTYTQTFDSLASGLPNGWSVYTSASATTLGTLGAFTTAATAWNGTSTGTDFRNIASDAIATSASSSTQSADTHRAFGWRPLGTASRNGALVAKFASSSGLGLGAISVRLFTTNDVTSNQTYVLEYRVGETGAFAQTGSTYTTGAPFGTATITADATALAALSNQASPIYLRVRGTATSGSGSLDTLGIDDFTLSIPPPTIATPPATQTAVVGNNVTFTVGATGVGIGGLTYQWRKGGTAIAGAISASYTLNSVTTTDAASYDVNVSDGNGTTTSAPATLTVTKATATVALGSLSPIYNGTARAATATTTPGGLTVAFTYNGSANAPTTAGSYTVIGTINDANYSGSASGTLTIAKATASIALANLSATYDGAAHAASAATSPAGLSMTLTYNGGSAAPTAAGSYAITATIFDPNYAGSASSILTIGKATQTISLGVIADHVTSDPPFGIGATASSGLPVAFAIMSGASIATVNGSTLTLAGGSNSGTVTVQVSQAGDANYLAAPTVSQSFTVAPPAATITAQPASQNVAAFQNVTFTVSASVSTGTLSYQWRKNGLPISGNASALTAAFTLLSVTFADAGTYDVIITAPNGIVTSFPATLTVTTASAAITLDSLSAVYDGSAHAVTATTSPANLAVTFTYNGSSTAPTAAGSYPVVATINDPNYSGSAIATLTIAKAAQTITFPAPAEALRATVPFTVNATASTGLTPITFTIVFGNGTALTTGPTSATITFPDTSPGIIRATQAGDNNYAAAFVEFPVSVNVAPAAPAFAMQPIAAASYLVGDTLTLSAAVTGVPAPTLQWRKAGIVIAATNTSATTATLTLPNVALTDAGSYDLVATNASGTVTSETITLIITRRPQTIAFEAPANAFAAAAPVKLGGTASSGLPVIFTIVSGAGAITGNTLTSLGANVVVRASQPGDATTTLPAPAVDRTFTFVTGGTAPFLFNLPLDQTVNAGAVVTFSTAAIGTPNPTWQWQKDGVAIAGATNASLALGSVTIADAARYTAVATNSVGSANATATLVVRAPPAIAASPASQTAFAGANVIFTATITGSPTPALQWRKNGLAIAGAVSNTLTLVNVRASDAARYDLVATSTLGTVTTAAATLTVATRDFSGTYFGKFASATTSGTSPGDFSLFVRADGSGVFLGYLPRSNTGLVTTNLAIDPAGNFSLSFVTTGASAFVRDQQSISGDASSSGVVSEFTPAIAAAPQTITLRGTLNDTTGALTATVPEFALTLDGLRAASTGPAAAQAGYYSGALVGTAAGRGYVIVGADGQAYVLTSSGETVAGLKTTLGANGRIVLTSGPSPAPDPGFTDLDLGFINGALAGTVRMASGITTSLNGASDTLAGAERLANLSARGDVMPGAPLIAGFVVTGASPKQILIRTAGPALAAAPFNLPNTLDDPALQLFRGNTIIASNDNWSTPAASVAALTAAATSVNAFAFSSGSGDAALLTTLAPGDYTVQVAAGAASRTGTGTALVELYEILEAAESPGARRLANLSARGPVAPSAPLIAGFVINGTAPQRVLIRGIGPALGAFGVPGALTNPTLTLFRGATILKINDDWFRDADAALIRDAAAKTGAFALGAASLDASLLLYLAPGAYTAQVSASGNTNGTGIALVEIYEVSP